jgi:2-polyprenyl-6-methoxyphenol hydroxylase-like FAD-dependent oxidoreductase
VEPSRRALVIGGSMSGLFAALALSRRGWDVEVFERVEGELAGRGAGIVAQPQLRAVFRAVGLDPDVELGVEVRRRRMLDRAGQVIGESECPQTPTSWDRLFRMLRDRFAAARYRRGMTLEYVEQHTGGVTAHFAGGATATGELLIGADGLRSSVRQQFLPDLAPLYAGYVAWRALIAEERSPPRSIAICSTTWSSRFRPASRSSAIRWRARTMICAPGTAVTIWSGTGPRTRRPSSRAC